MNITKKTKKKSSKDHAVRSSVIFLSIVLIALLSLWLPVIIS